MSRACDFGLMAQSVEKASAARAGSPNAINASKTNAPRKPEGVELSGEPPAAAGVLPPAVRSASLFGPDCVIIPLYTLAGISTNFHAS